MPNEGTRFLAINFRCIFSSDEFWQIRQRQLLARAWRYKAHIFGMDNENIILVLRVACSIYCTDTHFLKYVVCIYTQNFIISLAFIHTDTPSFLLSLLRLSRNQGKIQKNTPVQ
jgi:hypothetical protein